MAHAIVEVEYDKLFKWSKVRVVNEYGVESKAMFKGDVSEQIDQALAALGYSQGKDRPLK
jgi:hypothetical protein